MAGAHDYKISAMLGMVLLALGACSQDSVPSFSSTTTTHKAKTAPQTKRGPTVEELTTGMVQATMLGKSTLPLEVKFDLAEKPVKGQPLEINLALIPQVAGSQASVTLSSIQGFDAPDAKSFEFEHLEVGEVYRHTFKMTPSEEGVQLVGLSVSMSHDDASETKEFSIPVIVGH